MRPEFDVTPELPPGEAGGASLLRLGTVLDRNGIPAGPLSVPAASVNRHVFVCGATGAGKSQTVRALLEAASGAGLPWLVVEPAKAEYRLMSLRLDGPAGEVVRIRPGDADQVAAGINPLAPATGTGAGASRCRPMLTWSGHCSWRRSPGTSRSRRCCRPRSPACMRRLAGIWRWASR